MLTDFKFIDLFCGIGGFHQAMTSLGGKCVFASDIDKYCQNTYFKNYGIMPIGDITRVDETIIPEHDVLCGGFPCQAFSIAGKRLGFADPTKGTLFFDIMRIVNYHHPKYILLENVRNLASHDGGNTWRVIHQSIADAGYNVSPEPVIFSPHYIGVPQHRERVFIMAVRKDVGELPKFVFDRKDAPPCSIDTVLQDDSEIPHIERYRLKQTDIDIINNWNIFLQGLKKLGKPLPLFPVTDLFLKPSTSYFDYDSLEPEKAMTARRNVELYNSAPEFITDWLKEAYKNAKFKGSRRMLEWHAGKKIENPDIWETVISFRQSGIRCRPANHFPTLTAVVQIPVIGKLKRKLTPRECARLQSFPDTFQYDSRESQAYKQFGNSVNVEVVKLFARFLLGDREVQAKYGMTEAQIAAAAKRAAEAKALAIASGEKRKRGRPRKNPELTPEGKPKRGRPRKYPELTAEGKPKRGRPRKNPELTPDGKPKRGRPRKNPELTPDGKPKRGRPRKYPEATLSAQAPLAAGDPPVKRKRGRPRKYPLPTENPTISSTTTAPNEAPTPAPELPVKRKRGRPRKNPL